MAIKIIAGTDRTFGLDKGDGIVTPCQRGAYEVLPLSNNTVIRILRVGENTQSILIQGLLSEFVDDTNTAFADYQAFVDYIEPFFFRSIGGGGVGAVTSVFTRSGNVTAQIGDYTTGQVTEVTNKKYVTDAEKIVIGNTSSTNTGDETNASVKSKYEANANTNAYTDAEKTKLGNISGTNTGDETTATIQSKRPLKNVGGQTLEGTGNIPFPTQSVTSVFSRTGVITAQNGDYTTAQVTEVVDKRYVTDAQKVVIGNTNNINTGDETLASIQSKRPLKTVGGTSLEGTGNIPFPTQSVTGILTERISNQIISTQGTTNTTFITYLTLVQTKTLVATDKYLLVCSTSTSKADGGDSVQLRLRNWAVDIGIPYRVESKDNADRRIETFIFEIQPINLTGWNLDLQYASTGGAAPAQIHFALLQLQKINP